MIPEWRDARAVRAILGSGARVVSQQALQRRRNRRSVLATLADGSRVVVKYYWREALAAQEAVRLAAANRLASVDTPRYLGSRRHHLVQAYVPGASLDALRKTATLEIRRAHFTRAVQVLAAIHANAPENAGAVPLYEHDAPARLLARVRRARTEIETKGFPLWEAQQGSVPDRWRRALGERRIESLAHVLAATGEACVLGHGDFHPRHLLLTPDDRLFVVDWIAMSLVTPWIELARLLRWLPHEDRDRATAAYLDAMQRQGRLAHVGFPQAASLAASAVHYAHLIVAKQRVRKLARAGSPGHVTAFRASLDALAEDADR